MVIFFVWVLFPIINLVLISLKPQNILFDVPPKFIFRPTVQYYRDLAEGGQYLPFMNSIIIATVTTLATLFLGSMGAFAFVRFRFPMKKFLFFLILVTRMYPPLTTLIPAYFMIVYFGLIDTRTGLIIVYISHRLPLVIWIMRSFFATIPKEIQESAFLDGCSIGNMFLKIILPLSTPGLAATGILIFIFSWNEFLFALTFSSFNARTIPVAIMSFMEMEKGLKWQTLASMGFLAISPILVFMVISGKYLIKGLTLGALKG